MSATVSVPSTWRRGARAVPATPWLQYLVEVTGLAGVYYAVAKVVAEIGLYWIVLNERPTT